MRKFIVLMFAALLGAAHPAAADEQRTATVYKSPTCGCCNGHVEYLRLMGYRVTVHEVQDLMPVKEKYGVPAHLQSCHTALIGGYVVEGHVPVAAIERLLAEKPNIKGISLPGMPEGSPGMNGQKRGPFVYYEIAPGAPKVYATD